MRDMLQSTGLHGAYPKDYTSYNNIDFGTVKGLTIQYDLRKTGNVRLSAYYTLQFADATESTPTSTHGSYRIRCPKPKNDLPDLRPTAGIPLTSSLITIMVEEPNITAL